MIAMHTQMIISFDKMPSIELMEAPFTFLIPISFVLFLTENDINANNPMLEIKMANTEEILKIAEIRFSEWYLLSKLESRK